MMDDVNKNPEDEAESDKIESPVDGPTPDWMRLATSAGGSGSSLTEENTPAWLKSIRAGQGGTSEKKQAEPPQPPPVQPSASADDGLSDLERLLAEEGIDLGSVTEERPEGSGGMSARDWLISTSSEEIIRNKLGAQPPAAEPPAPATPVPVPAPASDDSMSDWERLLAEEGIDLGAIEEERPEGSGGMSARDWLIATSSEEIIRNKLGAQPEPEELPAPLPSATFSDDKMVVESDLPDWLQEIADDVAEAEASEAAWPVSEPEAPVSSPIGAKEDDLLVVTEELPDWLQEMTEDTSIAPVIPEEVRSPAPTGPFAAAEDKMVIEEDLPDWLRDIAEDEASFEQPQPTPAAIQTPAPLPETALPSFGVDKMVVEEDLPDWLQDLAEEDTAPPLTEPEETSTAPVFTDNLIVEEGLPDWLQNIAEEPEAAPEPPIQPELDFAAPPLPQSLAEDKMIVADDLPDWLREVADEPEPLEESEIVASIPPAASSDKMVVDEDLPDWLREVEAGSAEDVVLTQSGFEAATPELSELESEDDLPDWLREVEVSHLEDNLTLPPPKPIADLSTEESTFAPTSLSDDELNALDEEDLPSWLKEVQERDGRDTIDSSSKPLMTEFGLPTDLAGELAEDELPGWLRDVPEETTPLEFEPVESLTASTPVDDQMVIEEDLPDWLREEKFNLDEPFEPSEPSPETLPERVIGDLPDWLQEIQAETPEEALSFEETAEPVAAIPSGSPVANTMVDEEGLPDWLREVEAEEEVELPTFEMPAPVAEPEPVPEIATEITTSEVVVAEVEEEVEPIETPEPVEEMAEPETPAPIVEPEPISAPGEVVPAAESIPDWLQKLREVEEEPIVPVPTAPLPTPVQVAAPVRQAPQPVYAQAVAAPPDIPADAAEQLQLARTTRDKGNLDEAVRIYDGLVSRGIYLDKVIEDMQQSIKAQPNNYLLFQVMGDAMMRDGRLQSALNAYREALSRL